MNRISSVSLNMDDEELKRRGLSPQRVRALVKKLNECGKAAEEMGLTIFACSGTGEVMPHGEHLPENIIATIAHGNWDGGDY